MDHNECQICKAKGRYSKATTVHHVKHLREHPELALTIFDGKNRQLISVCDACHNRLHPEKWVKHEHKEPLTEERW